MARRKKKKNTGVKLFGIAFAIVVFIGLCIVLANPEILNKEQPQEELPVEDEVPIEEEVHELFPEVEDISLIWGETFTVDAPEFTFASSDDKIASVENGVITAKRTGTCTVTATGWDGEHLINIEVSPKIEMIDGVTYVNGILIANKTYGLPDDFGGNNDEAWAAFDAMAAAAEEEGLYLYASSVYRDYWTQKAIYDREYAQYGFDYVEGSTARPGHSEHQTGLAFDLNSISESFAYTDEGIWCAQHCHEFGFILRYMEGKEPITGYMYEPWHFRYIGEEATEIHESGLTLEEYLGIDSAYKN